MLNTIFLMFFSGVMVFCSFRKHLLITLFSLEYLVVSLFLVLFIFMLGFGFELYFLLFYLVFSVCEGSLGLGILVNMIRMYGNDLLSSLNLISW